MKTNPRNEMKVNIDEGEDEDEGNCRKTKAVFEGYNGDGSSESFHSVSSSFIWQQFSSFFSKRGMKIRNYWKWVGDDQENDVFISLKFVAMTSYAISKTKYFPLQ